MEPGICSPSARRKGTGGRGCCDFHLELVGAVGPPARSWLLRSRGHHRDLWLACEMWGRGWSCRIWLSPRWVVSELSWIVGHPAGTPPCTFFLEPEIMSKDTALRLFLTTTRLPVVHPLCSLGTVSLVGFSLATAVPELPRRSPTDNAELIGHGPAPPNVSSLVGNPRTPQNGGTWFEKHCSFVASSAHSLKYLP